MPTIYLLQYRPAVRQAPLLLLLLATFAHGAGAGFPVVAPEDPPPAFKGETDKKLKEEQQKRAKAEQNQEAAEKRAQDSVEDVKRIKADADKKLKEKDEEIRRLQSAPKSKPEVVVKEVTKEVVKPDPETEKRLRREEARRAKAVQSQEAAEKRAQDSVEEAKRIKVDAEKKLKEKDDEIRRLQSAQERKPDVVAYAPKQVLRDKFLDGSGTAPELVVLPQGHYTRGSPDGSKGTTKEVGRSDIEGPTYDVKIAYTLAVGKYEITRGEFAQFVNEKKGYKTAAEVSGGCALFDYESNTYFFREEKSWRDPGFLQDDEHPVVCVSWNDTQDYLEWLNQKTGFAKKPKEQRFRLLTEAEWEYAARDDQGSQRFPWGDDPEYKQICKFANGKDQALVEKEGMEPKFPAAQCSDKFPYTAPKGALPASKNFGLHNMLGNAKEWVQDCFVNTYRDALLDGKAVDTGSCDWRVLRGGSWYDSPYFLRAANRHVQEPGERFNGMGFRISRKLP